MARPPCSPCSLQRVRGFGHCLVTTGSEWDLPERRSQCRPARRSTLTTADLPDGPPEARSYHAGELGKLGVSWNRRAGQDLLSASQGRSGIAVAAKGGVAAAEPQRRLARPAAVGVELPPECIGRSRRGPRRSPPGSAAGRVRPLRWAGSLAAPFPATPGRRAARRRDARARRARAGRRRSPRGDGHAARRARAPPRASPPSRGPYTRARARGRPPSRRGNRWTGARDGTRPR